MKCMTKAAGLLLHEIDLAYAGGGVMSAICQRLSSALRTVKCYPSADGTCFEMADSAPWLGSGPAFPAFLYVRLALRITRIFAMLEIS